MVEIEELPAEELIRRFETVILRRITKPPIQIGSEVIPEIPDDEETLLRAEIIRRLK